MTSQECISWEIFERGTMFFSKL